MSRPVEGRPRRTLIQGQTQKLLDPDECEEGRMWLIGTFKKLFSSLRMRFHGGSDTVTIKQEQVLKVGRLLS